MLGSTQNLSMRKFLLLGILLAAVSTSASHLVGGNITWECQGNNQYVFKLNLYRDCKPGTASLQPTERIFGPAGFITLQRDTVIDLSLRCNGPSTLKCDGPANSRKGIELHSYSSNVISLPGAPPATGWVFSYSLCCRTNSVANLNLISTSLSGTYIRSYMFPSSTGNCITSPYFDFNPAQQIINTTNSLSSLGQTSNPADSLYYDFEDPMADSINTVPWRVGFSATSPFPNTSTNPANGQVTINHSNGLIDFDIKAGLPGLYNYAVGIEQWREGILLSKIVVDNSVLGDFDTVANSAPTVFIDTTIYNFVRTGNVYRTEALTGDTIEFMVEAVDMDIDTATSLPQNIKFKATGYALDSNWNKGNAFTSDAILSPVAPQAGFTNTVNNKVNFYWVVGSEHFSGPGTNHAFHFELTDDNCPFVGLSNIIVEVKIKDAVYIKADTLAICEADSAQLKGITASGNYLWTPNVAISSDSISSPKVSPTTSQWYYLTDPQNPGFIDSVYIDVTKGGTFSLAFNAGQLQLTDSTAANSHTWYYNNIPFINPNDTITPFGLGTYYVIGSKDSCTYYSDTVTVTSGASYSMMVVGNGDYRGSPNLITGSIGATFSVNQNVNVYSVSIPGLQDLYGKTGGYDFKLQFFDASKTEIFNTDLTLAKPFDKVLKVATAVSLSPNTDYTIVVSGDTGYAFNLYRNVTYPYSPYNVGLTVKSGAIGAYGQFPVQPWNLLLPISLGIDKTVGLHEMNENLWNVFPNPATNQIQINGVADAKFVDLIDANGRVVRHLNLRDNQNTILMNRNELPSGLYFIKVQFENSTSVKKILFQ